MNSLEELKIQEARREVRGYIQKMFDRTHIDRKQDEEIKAILKESLKKSIEAAERAKLNTDGLVISEANTKRKTAQEKIDKFSGMLKVFDEEFENFITLHHESNKLRKSVAKLKTEKNINVNEMVERIKKQAEEKYPIPQGGDER